MDVQWPSRPQQLCEVRSMKNSGADDEATRAPCRGSSGGRLGTVKEQRCSRKAEWHSNRFPGSVEEKKKSSGKCGEIALHSRGHGPCRPPSAPPTHPRLPLRASIRAQGGERKWCTEHNNFFYFFGSGFRDTDEHRKNDLLDSGAWSVNEKCSCSQDLSGLCEHLIYLFYRGMYMTDTVSGTWKVLHHFLLHWCLSGAK